jgi:hypothetical protein
MGEFDDLEDFSHLPDNDLSTPYAKWGHGRIPGSRNRRYLYCPRGHLVEGDNLIVKFYVKKGKKYKVHQCRTCKNEGQKRRRERKKEEKLT